METKELIDLLNDDLGTEYRSIVQYVQHIAVVTGDLVTSDIAMRTVAPIGIAKLLARIGSPKL